MESLNESQTFIEQTEVAVDNSESDSNCAKSQLEDDSLVEESDDKKGPQTLL